MTKSDERKSGAILSYVSIILSTLVQLIYTPLLIRMLGQSEYGLYSLVSSIIGYLTVLDLGFGNAIVIFTAKYRAQKKYDEEKKLHGMFFVVYFVIGIVAGIIGIILYFFVPIMFGASMSDVEIGKMKTMMLILAFNLAITFIFSIYSSIINAYEKFTFQKIMSILNTVMKPLIMIPLLFLGFKSITMCVVITIVNIIVLISNYLYCKNKLNIKIKFLGFDKTLFKTIINYSFFIFLGVIVDKINWSVDQFVLGAISGTVAVAIYNVASQINTLFINLSTAISGVLLPKMSKLVASHATNDELTNEFIKVGRIQYFIVFFMASSLVIFGKEFILFWVGEDYILSYYIAMILILPLCFSLIQNLGISIRQAMNKHKFAAFLNIVVAAFNLIISIFLAKKFGAIGAALGTALGIIISIIVIDIYYQKIIKLNIIKFFKEICKLTLTFLLPIIIIFLLKRFIQLQGLLYLIVFGGTYFVIYSINAYFISMNKYEKNIVNKILQKFMRCKNEVKKFE